MKKLNLARKVLNLDGTENNDSTGRALAHFLANSTGQDGSRSVKLWDWSIAAFNDKPIMIDASDEDWLRNFIDKHPQMPVWLKSQVLNRLGEAVEAGE